MERSFGMELNHLNAGLDDASVNESGPDRDSLREIPVFQLVSALSGLDPRQLPSHFFRIEALAERDVAVTSRAAK